MNIKRQEIMELAEKMYVPLMTKVANRFFNNEPYTVSDTVGYECTRLEELFRPLWGISALINERDIVISTSRGDFPLPELINKIFLEGTAPDSPLRFDRNATDVYGFANQATTEIAAYLVTVLFAKEKLWDPMNEKEKKQISDFIIKWATIAMNHSWPNNHYWYPIICIEILKRLGFKNTEASEAIEAGYKELDKLYVDKGWYTDGVFGRFDFYHAWAHHTYSLLWILIADKNAPGYEKRAAEYKKRSEEYIKFYCHFFDSDGSMAAYGRSLSYRFAAVSIFGLAAAVNCDIDYPQARTIISKNINYFFNNSIPRSDNTFPVGYLYEADGFGESYASEGASCCYSQGFMCLLAGDDHPLWNSANGEESVPVERGDFKVKAPLKGVNILLSGENDVNGVTLYNNSIHYYQDKFFSHRFNDMSNFYSKFAYNSRSGFGISTHDLISNDNMFTLMTTDGRMQSERSGFEDLGEKDGVLISRHTPFSNDKETTVTTYLCPLDGGWHIRIHKIELSMPYIVCEGGFSIGFTDDSYKFDNGTLIYNKFVSKIIASGIDGNYRKGTICPGMHLLKPQAAYPKFISKPLEKGTYTLVLKVGFTSCDNLKAEPEAILNGNTVKIITDSQEKTIII